MSDTANIAATERVRVDWIIFGIIGALCIGIFLYVMAGRQYALRDSSTGFDGLELWLRDQGHTAQTFTGGWPLDRSTIGLLIQPIYDTQPGKDRARAQTKDELLLQPDEFDQTLDVIRDKAQSTPSLVILPKWRSGLRLTGLGHPILLSPEEGIEAVLHGIVGSNVGTIRSARVPFTDFDVASDDALTARLYAAQVFDGQGCEPRVGRRGAMVLGLCPLPGDGEQQNVHVLSDPDLMNNHGLVLGDNARIAARVLPEIAGEKRIIIDYSDRNWLTDPQQHVARERTWDDLKRLFEPPFLTLWIGAGLLLALAVWRGGVRSGPVADLSLGLGSGKRTANRVRARLMRMTDQDGALLSDFIDTRLRARAASVFGTSHALRGTPEDAYLNYIRTRKPDLTAKLEDLIASIRALPPHLGPEHAIPYVDQFELILEQLADDA
ncbi:hypothetical protein [Ruegeria profundi]|uniref:hypothetical protein n=1 Tax=Ruegeria profundi TaxID=1685378 RepID=UPI003C799AD5